MKKLLLGLLLVSGLASAQVISNDLISIRIGSVNLKQVEKTEDGTVVDVNSYLYFQNAKYQHISDLKFIWLTSQSKVDKLFEDLNKMLMVPEGTEASLGVFRTYDFATKSLYIQADGGYTRITRKQGYKLAEALAGFEL